MILSCYLLENEITGIWVEDPAKVAERWTALASYLTEERLVRCWFPVYMMVHHFMVRYI